MSSQVKLTIDIALAADNGYFGGLLVTACSIAKYADNSVKLRFNILDGGIDNSNWNLLERKVSVFHSYSEIRRILVNDELFQNYPLWHGNRMAYARLILPDALACVDWCIYCDVDFLWMKDIAELWAERENRYTLIGTKDGAQWTLDREKVWFEGNGYQFNPNTYFCSGLCVFNLKAFREQNLINKVEEILKKHPDIQYPDQAALNIVTFGQTKIVSKCWQQFHQDVTAEMVKEGVVIHYAGAIPWKPINIKIGLMSDLMLLWHRMNAEIRGITLWQSLRMYFGVGHILWHRGLRDVLYTLNRIHCIAPFRFVLSATGHYGTWTYLQHGFSRLNGIFNPKKQAHHVH